MSQAEDLRQVMRNWASGVTIVTAADGTLREGMTVSSFTSISLEPPLVLISLEQGSRTNKLVKQTGSFGITILGEHQADLSDRFAGRSGKFNEARFEGLAVEFLSSGAPFIVGGLAFLDCHTVQSIETGTHTLFIGEVIAMSGIQAGRPLLYFDRQYHWLGKTA